jgi:rfaE bifunctional protein kinase chain/domain
MKPTFRPRTVRADAILNNLMEGRWVDAAHLLSLVGALRSRTVAVIGDVMADEYVYGRVARISREAPVLILEYDSTEIVPGGGANAANNVAALGGRATLVGLVGRDEPGRRLVDALEARVDCRGVVRAKARATPVKTRILAGGIHSAKQQVVRIDRAVNGSVDKDSRRTFDTRALAAALKADAVLISDYGSGLVTGALVSKIKTAIRKNGHPIPILIDSRYRLLEYKGLTACTPNESEVEQALGVRINDSLAVLERAGRAILERTACRRADHARRPRHGAVRARRADRAHPDLRIGSDRRRHRRGRYRDGDDDPGAGGRGDVRGRGTPRQLRGRHRGDEARHGNGQRRRASRRGPRRWSVAAWVTC